jgi:hypothetical protein
MSFTFFCLIKSGRKVNKDSDKLAPIHLDKDHTIPEYLDTDQANDVTMDTVHRPDSRTQKELDEQKGVQHTNALYLLCKL